jgi:hypothetical protein
MKIKVILSWNIIPGKEQEYYHFVLTEFLPTANKLGLGVTDAWATLYGGPPQIVVGAIAASLQEARRLLASEDWLALTDQLQEYVTDLNVKIVNARSGFQF